MPDLKPNVQECKEHSEDDINWFDGIKYCFKCGKEINTISDEIKIKRTHDIGS
jgi:hypothetical protein